MWILDELEKKKNDDTPAMIHRDNKASWKDLWNRSEAIGQWICENTNGSSPVIIYGNKDIDILSVMIASLKTGRAYVPVDVTFPVERLLTIADVTETEAIFDFSGRNFTHEGSVIVRKEEIEVIEKKHAEQLPKNNWVSDEDVCYILFTSGSTGEPKGVQISRKNILNFVSWFAPKCELKTGSVALNQVSYSFDVSVIQLYIYLAAGVTLFNIDKAMIDNLGELFEYLEKSRIASWVSTPAFMEICALDDSFNKELLPELEKIVLAGEVLTKKLVRSLWDKFPGAEVINGYGPTEGTVLLSCCTINDEMISAEDSLPIGNVIPEAKHHIEIGAGVDVTDGEKGELVVVSNSISKGYYKNPSATKKSFFTDGERNGYHTGDIVYRRNNMIYYCQRKDFQIKLNGYRIELDDVAENLNKLECVSNSIVLPVYRDSRVSFITAFIVLTHDLGLSPAKTSIFIKNELKKRVPSYMVPRKMIVIDSFPLNTNGKIDRKKLMEEFL